MASGASAFNGINNLYQGYIQQNPAMMAQGGGSLAIGLMNPSCFVAGTRVLVPDCGQRPELALTRSESAPLGDNGEQGLAFWPLLVLAVGIGGCAAALGKSPEDDEQRRRAALRSLFGEEDDKLEDEDTRDRAMDFEFDRHDYERRIDALCEALCQGDESLEAAAAGSDELSVSCRAVTRAVRPAPRRRQASMRGETVLASVRRPRQRCIAKPPRRRAGSILLLTCLILAGLLGLRSPTPRSVPPLARGAGMPGEARKHETVAIETIRVGQRVLGENPQLAATEHSTRTAVDPATWRLLKLHSEWRWPDGTLDTIEIETLQPPTWIAEHCAREGSSVPLPLDVTEMGMPEHLRASVVSIEACPEIEEGPGHVVTTTINHLNAFICDLTVEDTSGGRETIKPTGYHKFYSDTRKGWVAACELRRGEQLRGVDGPLTVATLKHLPGVERVYNVTVEGQHVYRVSALGALVHNADCVPTGFGGDGATADTPFTNAQYQDYIAQQAQASEEMGQAFATLNTAKAEAVMDQYEALHNWFINWFIGSGN